jgi:membrane-associated protease RseP (regulator of RpoE activity)
MLMNKLVRGIAYCFLALPSVLVLQAGQDLFGSGGGGFVLSVALYAVIIFVTIFVHEAGHAVAALKIGWRVTLFAVFPLAYRTKTRKLEFWVLPSGDLGGMVSVATDGKLRTRRRSIMLSAAGPLANFAFSAIAFCLIYLLPWAQIVVGSMAVSSLFVGLGNLLPWRARNGMKSDGAAILSELRAGKWASL